MICMYHMPANSANPSASQASRSPAGSTAGDRRQQVRLARVEPQLQHVAAQHDVVHARDSSGGGEMFDLIEHGVIRGLQGRECGNGECSDGDHESSREEG
jgi:hypothetical protein